jgi:hypothetical protein
VWEPLGVRVWDGEIPRDLTKPLRLHYAEWLASGATARTGARLAYRGDQAVQIARHLDHGHTPHRRERGQPWRPPLEGHGGEHEIAMAGPRPPQRRQSKDTLRGGLTGVSLRFESEVRIEHRHQGLWAVREHAQSEPGIACGDYREALLLQQQSQRGAHLVILNRQQYRHLPLLSSRR